MLPLAPARRLALIVISVGLLIAGAGIVLVLVFDTLLGFIAVAAGVLGARSGERRWAYIAYLERRGGRYATPAMLGAASWIPSFSGGSEGPYLGGTGDNLGAGGDGGGSEYRCSAEGSLAAHRSRSPNGCGRSETLLAGCRTRSARECHEAPS